MWTSDKLRELFLDYFRERGHKIVRSSPLVPAKDPTMLFTNAGMVQFKDVFLGKETRAYTRAASVQKCLRVSGKHNDLEQVGLTARHNTFFEMLGNFSFGDYFKKEAVEFAWEFTTKVVGLPADRFYITVHHQDDDARRLWEACGVASERIFGLGDKDNFWSMGDVGPCGPCSELLFDLGEGLGCGRPECAPGCDCDRFFEVWNLVFMQFERTADGKLQPLPSPSVDTGMGLERLCCVSQGKTSVFETDLFRPILAAISNLSQVPVAKEGPKAVAFRAIADHIRAHCFLIADGVMPSNEGRGYVLRRLIRRASRFGQVIGLAEPFLFRLAGEVIERMGPAYPELFAQREQIPRIIKSEEERFQNTLNRCSPLVEEYVASVKASGGKVLDGEKVFSFYDTYGYPLDLVRDIARENGLAVDEEGFQRAMHRQRERARLATGDYFGHKQEEECYDGLGPTEFLGYQKRQVDDCLVTRVIKVEDGRKSVVPSAAEGDRVEVVLDRTPFYAEAGGQVSDNGEIESEDVYVVVDSVQKRGDGAFVHGGVVKKGRLVAGEHVSCRVDSGRRDALRRSHTATHLLHYALRCVLGQHVKQSGSLVAEDRLRFDFTHFGAVSRRELDVIEALVNEKVREDAPVTATVLTFDEAVSQGALAFFGEKYGQHVRMVDIGGFSKELCGGTHVSRTGQIGLFRAVSSTSVSSGVRRIEALTGPASLEYDNHRIRQLERIAEMLKSPVDTAHNRLKAVLSELRALRQKLEAQKSQAVEALAARLTKRTSSVNGVNVIAEAFEGEPIEFLRSICDRLRTAGFSGVAVLGSSNQGKVSLVCLVSKDLLERLDAAKIVKEVSAVVGGSGGGRRDLAQAGGTRPEMLKQAVGLAPKVVAEALAQRPND